MGKSALVLGVTGVVGRELVCELRESPGYDEVEAWAHRQTDFCHFKLCMRIIDFEGISDIAPHKFDEIFCALGTTMKQAGSREAFLRVDVDNVYAAAKWGIASGARRFALISSQGADERSRFFYLRAKGKAEKKIAALGFKSLQIARLPAIKSEREQVRMGELFTIWLFGLLPKFILTNYRPMSTKDIAAAVIAAAQTEAKGVQIYHPREFL